jgi:hypothetical protein
MKARKLRLPRRKLLLLILLRIESMLEVYPAVVGEVRVVSEGQAYQGSLLSTPIKGNIISVTFNYFISLPLSISIYFTPVIRFHLQLLLWWESSPSWEHAEGFGWSNNNDNKAINRFLITNLFYFIPFYFIAAWLFSSSKQDGAMILLIRQKTFLKKGF